MAAPRNIFANNALELLAYGLAVLPCQGDDGKVPILTGFNKWRRPPSVKTVERWAQRFPDYNIGFLPGPSKVLVVDVDRADQAGEVEQLFGRTPLHIIKGRGPHLYYRDPKCSWLPGNLTALGLKVDLKAGNSVVIAPPSQHHSGGFYQHNGCGWEDLERLPLPKLEWLQEVLRTEANPKAGMRDGSRRQWLNDQLCKEATSCDTFDDLLDVARTRNEEISRRFPGSDPLPDTIVIQRARKVWEDVEAGWLEMWHGRKAVVRTCKAETRQIVGAGRDGTDAFALLMLLRADHSARCRQGNTFALVTKAMQAAQTMPGWHSKRYAKAIKTLLALGLLSQANGPQWTSSGRRPAQYRLAAPNDGWAGGGG